MENKYNKYFWEFEQKHKEKAKIINDELEKQYNAKNLNEFLEKNYLDSVCLNFHLYNDELKRWVIYNVLSHFAKETLISCYLIKLTDALMVKNVNQINSLISSFKDIGLIRSGILKENKIILVTNDNEMVKVKNVFNDKDYRDQFKGRCHSGCEFLVNKEQSLRHGSYIVTLRDSFVDKYPIYHSVILSEKGYIIDPARNMIMKLDDYKKLFKPYSIMCINSENMIEEIEKLKEVDEDFNNCNFSNVLKLAINRQISK